MTGVTSCAQPATAQAQASAIDSLSCTLFSHPQIPRVSEPPLHTGDYGSLPKVTPKHCALLLGLAAHSATLLALSALRSSQRPTDSLIGLNRIPGLGCRHSAK